MGPPSPPTRGLFTGQSTPFQGDPRSIALGLHPAALATLGRSGRGRRPADGDPGSVKRGGNLDGNRPEVGSRRGAPPLGGDRGSVWMGVDSHRGRPAVGLGGGRFASGETRGRSRAAEASTEREPRSVRGGGRAPRGPTKRVAGTKSSAACEDVRYSRIANIARPWSTTSPSTATMAARNPVPSPSLSSLRRACRTRCG